MQAAFDTTSALLDSEVLAQFDLRKRYRFNETQRESVDLTHFSCLNCPQATEICRRFRQSIAVRVKGVFLQIPSRGRVERDGRSRRSCIGLADAGFNHEKTGNDRA